MVSEARLKTLEPKLSFGTVTAAGHATLEGHVNPVRATELLLAEAVRLGARVEHPCEVTGLNQAGGAGCAP